jgi:hypothetical protein
VYVGNNSTQLFVRALDTLEPSVIATGVQVRNPFVSPNGQWVGIADSTLTLKKVSITGGPAIEVVNRLDGPLRGATWATDGSIIFATNNSATGLQRVPAAGGTPVVLTTPDNARGETHHLWPEVLPGGRAVLFTITAAARTPRRSACSICRRAPPRSCCAVEATRSTPRAGTWCTGRRVPCEPCPSI